MSKTDTIADPVAAAQAAREAGAQKLRELRERKAARESAEAAQRAQEEAEEAAAELEFADVVAREDHANRVAERQARVHAAQAAYTTAASAADEKHRRVLELRQQLAEAQADYYPAELGRVQTGEHYKAEVRELEHLEPGLATVPAVPGKRLADHRPDATEAGLREFTLTAHPDVRSALDRLIKHEVWKEPQFAMVQGRPYRIS